MPEYEHDEFDDVPAESPHRGAYRADPADRAGGYRGTALMIVLGICALVLGGVMFLIAPRTSAPGASPVEASAAPSPSAESSNGASGSPGDSDASANPSGSASGEAADVEADPNTTVGVYNDRQAAGVATEAASNLEGAGWTVSDVTAWDGSAQTESVVYYAPGSQEQAEGVARELGIQRTEEVPGYFYQVVVVMAG